uniref:ParE toxin of type II toxin-antitoxin system, parDE n=1 Tax=Candidatus Kentrum sp. MB TaxID=2138164 RepID=A0A450X7J1_9GAMM|nr:MAG: ParE toxin of type II toxin-antitoxin system, parDE [Candidatus Kentron sp. MB]VFK31524.1 MAG: ParE toxin of type II toxin-antitoxin system, parDE [Candidatus Kentron sp. MB]VFK75549.1 MAG: ParE toxin of type II toxin-antitoxin system, parDE [Candidatus Kentron sp. MB]
MSTVRFDPDARAEFLTAIKYYNAYQPGLGRRFRLAVEVELDHIRNMPFGFRVIHAPFRRCLVRKFPYAIIFSIEPKFILVIAVAHTRRKPGYWHERSDRYKSSGVEMGTHERRVYWQ